MVYASFKINILNRDHNYIFYFVLLYLLLFLILEVLLLDCSITFCFDNEQNKIRNKVLLLFIMTKVVNIGFDGYIGTWFLRIYQRYVDGYFYINIGN